MRNWNSNSREESSSPASFSAYLWGIETFWIFFDGQADLLFSAYLWGIETHRARRSHEGLVCSQPTYEELKHTSTKSMQYNMHVLSLPMRNWNLAAQAKQGMPVPVLSLPMRNWNACGETHSLEVTGSQPTYEELKPRGKTMLCPTIIEVLSLPMRNWNRRLKNYNSKTAGVLSLPMRNWNNILEEKGEKKALVLSLPMRNWNTNKGSRTYYIITFSAYLWGIETLLPELFSHKKIGSQPTYEELKL